MSNPKDCPVCRLTTRNNCVRCYEGEFLGECRRTVLSCGCEFHSHCLQLFTEKRVPISSVDGYCLGMGVAGKCPACGKVRL